MMEMSNSVLTGQKIVFIEFNFLLFEVFIVRIQSETVFLSKSSFVTKDFPQNLCFVSV